MALITQSLTREFERGASEFRAVSEVSLRVEPGEFAVVVGRSGSGKSTLLHLIAGLLNPTSGSVEADGVNISALNDRAASAYRNEKVGFVPQGQSTLSSLTVLDNVRLPHYLEKRGGEPTRRARELLERVGLAPLAGSYPNLLSGGEGKRVAIARALINSPAYLLADEPTSDLDVQTTREILELLREIADGGTAVVMVTHELDALGYADCIYRMDAGTLHPEQRQSAAGQGQTHV